MGSEMIQLTTKGSFKQTEAYLRKLANGDIFAALGRYGAMGVAALAAATPKDSGKTSESWTYKVTHSSGSWKIAWINTNVDDQGKPIAILLQYGHGTGTGGYVQGRDYINPAIKPIFEQIKAQVEKEVKSR